MNALTEVSSAYREIMKSSSYRRAMPLVTLAVFAAFILLPAWLIPFNTVAFQFQILRGSDYVVYAALSAATASLLLMQVFLFRKSRDAKERVRSLGQGGLGAYSAILGGLMATAACSSCIAGLFGFLGVGAVFFVGKNIRLLTVLALALMLVSLYFTARRVNGTCKPCEDACPNP